MQNTSTILMIRPAAFGFNEETAADNFFQRKITSLTQDKIQQAVLKEFDGFADALLKKGIEVIIIDDTAIPPKSDAIFPNNWFLTLPAGSLSVFPMYAPSRRLEKRDDILQQLNKEFEVTRFTDWSELEADGFFLEGTGSMVMDHDNKIIYACLSQRTHLSAIEKFSQINDYRAISFEAIDNTGKAIYHTNVMLCVGKDFAVIGDKCFTDELEWVAVSQLLRSTGHEIIPISHKQVSAFAGNMLQVKNNKEVPFLVMSKTAYDSLTKKQRLQLQKFNDLLPVSIPTIETIGGGSARCMMAEIFLERKVDNRK
jgi:hypothetical protein